MVTGAEELNMTQQLQSLNSIALSEVTVDTM